MPLTYRPGNAQHVGARDAQQDAFALSDLADAAFAAHGGVLAVVADGMGGLAHGAAASQTATRALLASYLAKPPEQGVTAALAAAVRRANREVAALAGIAGGEGSLGSTLAAVVLHRGALHWASLG